MGWNHQLNKLYGFQNDVQLNCHSPPIFVGKKMIPNLTTALEIANYGRSQSSHVLVRFSMVYMFSYNIVTRRHSWISFRWYVERGIVFCSGKYVWPLTWSEPGEQLRQQVSFLMTQYIADVNSHCHGFLVSRTRLIWTYHFDSFSVSFHFLRTIINYDHRITADHKMCGFHVVFFKTSH